MKIIYQKSNTFFMLGNFKILIACEYSAIVREAFKKRGFDATSCDILDSEVQGKHYKGDIFDILYSEDWSMLIAFPPCTYLSAAGLYLCNIEKYGEKAIKRIENRKNAVDFFLRLHSAPIKHICIENPTGFISANIIKPSQIVHPYYFGEPQMKRTCFWLKNLPILKHFKEDNLFCSKTYTQKPVPISIDKKTGKKRYFTDALVKNELKSSHQRNKTFQSIANAMAEQWGEYIKENYI